MVGVLFKHKGTTDVDAYAHSRRWPGDVSKVQVHRIVT